MTPTGTCSSVFRAFVLWAALWPAAAYTGVTIVVDTTSDIIAADGHCSLREAITAANNNGNYSGCNASGGGFDHIQFSFGLARPAINLASTLPAITDAIEIDGGLDRVEIRPPASPGTGLSVTGAQAAGTVIRNLVLHGFTTAIALADVTDVVIAGNRIGTNAAGTFAIPNSHGISLSFSTAQIGSATGVTPQGPCTGDCNLISGNTVDGIQVGEGSSADIQGNFIGTDATGTAAIGNGDGIYLYQSTALIGGLATGEGNLISGNTTGVRVFAQLYAPGLATGIAGNRIGSDGAGTAAVPNGTGISVSIGTGGYLLLIGDSVAGAGNLISGNTGAGISMTLSEGVLVRNNRIGTTLGGTGALPNGGAGVHLGYATRGSVIGGIAANQSNEIAWNAVGVRMEANTFGNSVRGNSIHDNSGKGIQLDDFQTSTIVAPTVTTAAPVAGFACANCLVDVYADSADEGRVYQGSTTADSLGAWSFPGQVSGPNVTATANAVTMGFGGTSEFSVPVPVPDSDSDGVTDPVDNCTAVANPGQLDADADGYGNLCDADLNNSGLTTATDFGLMRSCLNQPAGSSPTCAAADMNGSGLVTSTDFGLLRSRLNQPPGPSGIAPD